METKIQRAPGHGPRRTRHAARATQHEQKALAETETARRALARAKLALADLGFRTVDPAAMARHLDDVPQDLRDQGWDYLSAKRDVSLGALQVEGFDEVTEVAAVPGRPAQFAVANSRGRIGIVDVTTRQVLHRWETGLKSSPTLAFTTDGSRLLSTAAGAPGIQIYRSADWTLEQSVPSPGSAVHRLALSPDGNLLAAFDDAPKNPSLSLVDLRDSTLRWRRPGHLAGVGVLFSPDGTRLFVNDGNSGTFKVLGVELGNVISELRAMAGCMAMSLDGRRIALGLLTRQVALIDVATGLETQRTRLHAGKIYHLAWTAGNHLITEGCEDDIEPIQVRKVTRLWSSTLLARGTFFGTKDGNFSVGWDFHPQSGHLLTASRPGQPPRWWHIPADLEAARIVSQAEGRWSTCFLSDTLMLGRKATGWELAFYDVTNPRQLKELPPRAPPGYVMSASCWNAGLCALAQRLGAGFSIKIYRHDSGGPAVLREIPMPEWTLRMDFDPPGERLIALTGGHGAFVFDVGSGETRLKLPQKLERAVFAGRNGDIAAVISKERSAGGMKDELVLLDSKAGRPIKSLLLPYRINDLAVSPDGRLIAIAGQESAVQVLDAETLEERANLRAHDAEITALAFHPKLPVVATASADGSVKLWDYETARLRETMLGLDGTPMMLAFSPNGRLLSVESLEHTARLYDLDALSAFRPPAPATPRPPAGAPTTQTKAGF